MTIDELIEQLQDFRERHGNLVVKKTSNDDGLGITPIDYPCLFGDKCGNVCAI